MRSGWVSPLKKTGDQGVVEPRSEPMDLLGLVGEALKATDLRPLSGR
jgi:hypothetical protein